MRALDAIVRLGSFVEAARMLHVTPAALSLSIRELEDRLGFSVLERTTRSLRPTQAGLAYLPFARRVLSELDEAERFARETREGHGVVRIATTPAIIATLLAAALPDVHLRWPKVRIHPLDVATAGVADSLAAGHADLAIGVHMHSDERFDVIPCFQSQWSAYISQYNPLAYRERLSWADIADQRVFTNQSSVALLRLTLGEAMPIQDLEEAATVFAGFAMASTGTGVALFPGYVHPFATISGLRRKRIEAPVVMHTLQIAAARRPSNAAPLVEIRDLIAQSIQARCAEFG